MILGLDISTSVVGWSILDLSGKLIDYGYVDMTPKKLKLETNLFKKLNYFKQVFGPVLAIYRDRITIWGVEEAVKKFAGGLSTANTIFKLGAFNFGVSYWIWDLMGTEPTYIPVTTARRLCGVKVPRHLDKKAKKAHVVQRCAAKYPSITWDLTRNGTYKKYCFDIADSLLISESTLRLHEGCSI